VLSARAIFIEYPFLPAAIGIPFVALGRSREAAGWSELGIVIMAVTLWALASMIYFPVAEAVFGQTLGKKLFGLAVVTESGLAIGAKEAILRRIPYIFHMAIMLDVIFIFFGKKHQRVFDHVAGTVVVEAA
jgi:uncharacterized RDD family membrane protein YckC